MARVDPLHETYYATGYPSFSHHHSYPVHGVHGFRARARSPVSSLGRSSPDSDDYCHQDSKSKMRWILSLGLLLPALAAIIGVVAWAVSAEVVMGARRASALRASEAAFRFSQGPNELSEWHSVMDNEAVPGPSPVDGRDNEYDDVGGSLDATTSVPSSSSSSSSSSSPSSPSSPSSSPSSSITPSSVASSTTFKSQSTSKSTPVTTASTTTVISTKQPVSTSSDAVISSLGKSDKNASSIFFLNGVDTSSSPASNKEGSGRKKSPGDQVAEVINQLVASRNYKGTRPQIVVVAPISDKKRKTLLNDTSTTTTSKTITRAATVLTTVRPTTRSAKAKSSTKSSTKAKSTTTTTSTTTTSTTTTTTEEPETTTLFEAAASNKVYATSPPEAILSRDADTLLAAAHMLAARHKIIAMRSDDEDLSELTSVGKRNEETITTTPRPGTTPFARINYQHFPPPRAVYDLPPPPPPKQLQTLHHPHHQQLHQQPQLTQNHHNHLNNHVHQIIPPPPPSSLANRDNPSSERINPIPMASHFVPTHILPPGRSLSMQPPPQMQIQQSLPQPQQVPLFVGQMGHPPPPPLPQNPALRFPHIPPPQMRPQFLASVPPMMAQAQQQQSQQQQQLQAPPPPMQLQLQPQPQQSQHQQQLQQPPPPPPAMGPFGPLTLQPTPASNFMTPGSEVPSNTEAVDESQLVSNSATSFATDESKSNAMVSFHANDPQTAASGSSKGLTFHFGGGPMGGGGQLMTSPVGIFKTLLLPLLPKPRVNLNGKVVFGVVLEKGVGFGKQKPSPIVKLHHL